MGRTKPSKSGLFEILFQIGRIGQMIGETLYYILSGRVNLKETFKQMTALGVESIPIVFVISGFTGMVFSLQVSQEFARFGAAALIGQILGIAIVRELAPVLTGVVVAGRAGAAIAAELGTMKVTEQVDALRALGTSPVQYLVAPRFLACVIMVPILTVFANLVGMLGGYFIAVYQVGVISEVFYEMTVLYLTFYDVAVSLMKALVFGIIIVTVSCDRGLRTERGAQGVGDSAISAVVGSMIAVFIANYFLSAFFFH